MKVVELLERMVGHATISSEPVTPMAALMAELAEDAGFSVERFEAGEGKANVVCTLGPEDADGLVLSGHMDVVPVDGQPWSSDPFRLDERDGRLYGRGTADMKGFLAAAAVALAGLDLSRLQRQLVLVWTCDEELGCLGSDKLAEQLLALDRRLPSHALVGEPTDFRILRQHAGHVRMRVEAWGAAAHSGMPWLGANALAAMARAILALEALRDEVHPTPLNPAVVSGGRAINIVPDRATLELGYRPRPGDDELAVFERIRQVLAGLELPEGTRVEPVVDVVTPSLDTPVGGALQALLTPHASSPEAGCAPFATDGGNLQRLGVRSLVFGPGSIAVAHKADEHVEAAALHRCVEVVRQVVLEHCT